MTDQPPTPPPGMPHFERPPTHAVPVPPTTPAAGTPDRVPPPRPAPTNPIARRPWVAAAGAVGAVVVAAAAGYGYGRQVEPAAPSATDGTSTVVSTGGDQQQVDPGTGQDPFSGSGSGQLPFELPGSGSGTDAGQSQGQGQGQGDPSGGFGAQPGTITPSQGQGGPTTQSGGS